MKFSFTIPVRLPGMNEIIGEARKSRFGGATQKKQCMKICSQYILTAQVPVFDVPVTVTLNWCEKDRRRDIDNIQAGSKFILDALVGMGRIPNDSQRWVRNVSHKMLEPEKDTPHVVVEIESV